MNSSIKVVLSVVCCFVSQVALSVQPSVTPPSPRKQLSSCMTKQMSASRSISYNDAMKMCKALIKSQEDNLIASNESKPAHAR